MDVTQQQLDRAALVLIVGEDGLYEWSATKPIDEVAAHLHKVADAIAGETP